MKTNKKMVVIYFLIILVSVVYCVMYFITRTTPDMTIEPLPEFPAKKVMEVAPANFVEIPAMERVSTNDPTEAALNKIGLSMSNSVKISVK